MARAPQFDKHRRPPYMTLPSDRTSARDSREAHLPAKQPCPQAAAWFSGAHGDRGGAARARPAARQGAQAPVLLRWQVYGFDVPDRLGPDVPDPQERGTRVERLKRRREFLAVAAAGKRWVTPAFVLQAGPRPALDGDPGSEVGLGFTVSRRIGKAVARNRARRRLSEAARAVLPGLADPGYNYVIVARPAVLTCPFQRLLDDLATAFARIHIRGSRRPRAPKGSPSSC